MYLPQNLHQHQQLEKCIPPVVMRTHKLHINKMGTRNVSWLGLNRCCIDRYKLLRIHAVNNVPPLTHLSTPVCGYPQNYYGYAQVSHMKQEKVYDQPVHQRDEYAQGSAPLHYEVASTRIKLYGGAKNVNITGAQMNVPPKDEIEAFQNGDGITVANTVMKLGYTMQEVAMNPVRPLMNPAAQVYFTRKFTFSVQSHGAVTNFLQHQLPKHDTLLRYRGSRLFLHNRPVSPNKKDTGDRY
ncbi:hypothetical protein CPB83DRAFT_346880 [Crepidotus variabilis]|uniref:Uncharacterized protein n=1 Tax=Crepidotus variabilis TaxID=179855 RepID=A0A9P6EGC4_9AGAR|nr:hypothetical protein CPB83DRAFT_346880 [Crepidotus variabilis]